MGNHNLRFISTGRSARNTDEESPFVNHIRLISTFSMHDEDGPFVTEMP